MYACGLRTSEAATLEIGAIDGRNLLLRVIGKGNKERLVPLPEQVLLSLRRLWKIHKNPRWLFPNRAGTHPIGRGTLIGPSQRRARQPASGVRRRRTAFATVMRHA
jgi:integrase